MKIDALMTVIGEMFERMVKNNENESMIFLLSVLLLYNQANFETFKEVIVHAFFPFPVQERIK